MVDKDHGESRDIPDEFPVNPPLYNYDGDRNDCQTSYEQDESNIPQPLARQKRVRPDVTEALTTI
jgi:hypothetical protein